MFRIFLDLDGVLANFHGPALALFGRPESDYYTVNGKHNWIHELMGISEQELWVKLDTVDFWENLPLMPDAKEIVDIVKSHCDNVFLATACKLGDFALVGKRRWIRRHFPEFQNRTLMGDAKEACANPEAILIDDLQDNIERFTDDMHVGAGILFPRKWNANYMVIHPIPFVDSAIRNLKSSIREYQRVLRHGGLSDGKGHIYT